MRIVVFAYACEPGRGSEPGAGWVMTRMIARLGETWVITTPEGREAIESTLPTLPERTKLHFVHVDLPPWAMTWKKGHRGIRLHYLLWQLMALRTARNLHREEAFDLSWHVTFSTVWLGSLLPRLSLPFIYGPVGGGVTPPWRLLPGLGVRGALYEITRVLVNRLGRYLNPLARSAWRRAALVLVQNTETREWLPSAHRHKACVFHHVAVEGQVLPSSRPHQDGPPTALFAGRLLPLKGVSLGIKAIAGIPDWRLIIYGRGPEEGRLRDLARDLGIEDRVEFRGWVAREELFRALREETDVFLLPCLHEEGGWAIAEAVVTGLPSVFLHLGGPPLIAHTSGFGVDPHGTERDVVAGLANALERARRSESMGLADESLTIQRRGAELKSIVSEVGIAPASRRP